MTGLTAYKKPTHQQLEEMTREQALAIDNHNRQAFARNLRFLEAAKGVLLDVEPTLRDVRDIVCPPPDVQYVQLWQERQDANALAEAAEDMPTG